MADTAGIPQAAVNAAPGPSAIALVRDADSEGLLRRCFLDLGMADAHVHHGSVETAIETLTKHAPPRLLVVDVSGLDDPMMQMGRLAEICDPSTEVIVIGDRNDIVLYRDLKTLGVAEYFFKPLVSTLVARACGRATTATAATGGRRTGKLIIVLGVRGGVGTTTVAVNAAWYFSEVRERRVALFDPDLQSGDAALQLDVAPNHALREALDHPDRVDDLFLERGIIQVTPRLGLVAGLEPLSNSIPMREDAVLQLLDKLLFRYRYVFVDVSAETALRLNKLLHLPSTILLVSDGSLVAARDVVRWRQRLGADTPERATIHVLNRMGGNASLPTEEFVRAVGHPPDITISEDRQVASGSTIGVKGMQKSSALRRAMDELCTRIAGAVPSAPRHSLISRILRPWA
jgi:pilus assembly protein CpaE